MLQAEHVSKFVLHKYMIEIRVNPMRDQHPVADANGAMVRCKVYDNYPMRKRINRDTNCASRRKSPVIGALTLREIMRSGIVFGSRMTNIQPTKYTSNYVDLGVRYLTIVVPKTATDLFKEVRSIEARWRWRRNKVASVFAVLT
jgi:hypothetical protein